MWPMDLLFINEITASDAGPDIISSHLFLLDRKKHLIKVEYKIVFTGNQHIYMQHDGCCTCCTLSVPDCCLEPFAVYRGNRLYISLILFFIVLLK